MLRPLENQQLSEQAVCYFLQSFILILSLARWLLITNFVFLKISIILWLLYVTLLTLITMFHLIVISDPSYSGFLLYVHISIIFIILFSLSVLATIDFFTLNQLSHLSLCKYVLTVFILLFMFFLLLSEFVNSSVCFGIVNS